MKQSNLLFVAKDQIDPIVKMRLLFSKHQNNNHRRRQRPQTTHRDVWRFKCGTMQFDKLARIASANKKLRKRERARTTSLN